MALTQSTPPTAEPLTVDEARAFLRVDTPDDDAVISRLIAVARTAAEVVTQRQLMPATFEWRLDCFPRIELFVPKPPLVTVTSIVYLDTAGVSQTWAASKYRVDDKSEPGRIEPAYSEFYPNTHPVSNAITITFTAGYADAASVPDTIKQGMLVLIAEMYDRRGEMTQGASLVPNRITSERLFGPDRVMDLALGVT